MNTPLASIRTSTLIILAFVGSVLLAVYEFAIARPGTSGTVASLDSQPLCAPETTSKTTSKEILFVGCGGFF